MFVINDIISIQEADGNKRLERIIWMDEGNVICYTIDMEKKKHSQSSGGPLIYSNCTKNSCYR